MEHFSAEQQALLHLLQSSLSKVEPLSEDILKNINWNTVLEEAKQQAVLLQVFDALSNYKAHVPKEVYQKWFQYATRILVSNTRVMAVQKELIDLLDEGNYPYMILKGAAAAAYYPKPELRSFGDVDFLIDPAQKDEIEGCLLGIGYQSEMHDHICHVVLKKPGAHLEMHFEIAGIPNGVSGERVRGFMDGALQRTVAGGIEQDLFNMPGKAEHGLILLLHMQHHMLGEGLGLRHLCDWACFVANTYTEGFWQDKLLPLLQQIGLYRYAAIMTKVGAIYLHTPCPDWATEPGDELCMEVMADILAGGNFGRKDIVRSRAGMMISDHGKDGTKHGAVYNLIHTLHQTTPQKYPFVTKWKVLHPVFDVVRGGQYAVRSLTGKRVSVHKMLPHAKERKILYEKLQIFEIVEDGDK